MIIGNSKSFHLGAQDTFNPPPPVPSSVVSHHGHTLSGGHYTCDVRVTSAGGGSADWWHCDDARVRKVAAAEVRQQQAYVLFYERIVEAVV